MHKKLLSVFLSMCMAASCTAVATTTATAATVEKTEVAANSYGLADNIQDGQILQCWNWSYNGIKNNMQKIAEQGFTAVQTTPIQTIKESTQGKTMKGSWWVYYQPSNFTIDTSSQNALGTKAEFEAMCEEAHKYGVKVIVDAVLNHMANKSGNDLSDTIPSDIRNDSSCWYSITVNTSNWNDRYDITHNCMDGLPDLNTSNSKIQNYAKTFLKECITAGVDGFRFDGAKHIETPDDRSGVSSSFWSTVLSETTSHAQSTRGFTPYYYGEVLDETGGVDITAYTKWMSVTDNGISNAIRNAVNNGNASEAANSYIGKGAAANKAVQWNESHDTYAGGNSIGVGNTALKKTWAIVGTRAQVAGMYFARPSSIENQIGTASVTAWGDKEVQAVNQFKNYFVGETEYLSSSGSIAYNERGTSGVVLVNCGGTSTSVSVPAKKMAAGTYTDQITGNKFTVSNGQISGNIGSTGIAVVYNPVPAGPSASVNPGSKNYTTDTLTLTLNYNNATSGQYSIDGGAYQSFTNGQTITIGSGVAYGTQTTVSVKASDGSTTSDAKSYTYTKVDPTLTQKIYFDNSSYNWSSVYAYIYSGETLNNGAWPGQAMTKDSATGYYVIEVPAGLENGAVIFTESETATTNRYPADMQPGLDLNGSTKLFKAGNAFVDYTPVTPTTKPSTTPTTQPTTPVDSVLIGDTNQDGQVTISDVTQLQLHLVQTVTLTGNALTAADCNGDKAVDITDATLIQYYCVKLFENAGNVGKYTGGQPTTQPTTKPTQPTTKPTQPTTQPTQPTTQPTNPSGGITVTFTNSLNWGGTIYCYYWPTGGQGPVAWPGTGMQSAGTNDFGEAMYTFTVPAGNTNVIFTNGSSQTVDISLDGGATRFYPKSSMSGSGHEVGTW
ncbi:MAG: starch-binding protein [Ruminococcus sp.]|nr:starch-binding protein [Ruminococcus sp.]